MNNLSEIKLQVNQSFMEDNECNYIVNLTNGISELPDENSKIIAKALYKNQMKRDQIISENYNEDHYNLESEFNLKYNSINSKINDILLSEPIKNYWMITLSNCKFWKINKNDKLVLQHLYKVELDYDNYFGKNFTVRFHFNKNKFFNHDVLENIYVFDKSADKYNQRQSTEIKWFDPPNYKYNDGKLVLIRSFFNIFLNGKNFEDEPDINEEAGFIQYDLIPFSMEYYLDFMKLSAIDDYYEEEDNLENVENRKI